MTRLAVLRIVALALGAAAGQGAMAANSEFTLHGPTWHLTSLGSDQVQVEATLVFSDDGTLSGKAPCNRFTGRYRANGTRVAVEPLAMTRMMCVEATMRAESVFAAGLQAAAHVGFEDDGRTLVLLDVDGQVLMRFAAR